MQVFMGIAIRPLGLLAIGLVLCLGCSPRSTEALVDELTDEDPFTRAKAASELTVRMDPATVGPLVTALDDESEDVRWEASLALVAIGRPAVEPLSAALKSKKDSLRRDAATVLYRIYESTHDPQLAERFAEALSRKDYAVVAGAYRYYLHGEMLGAEPVLIGAIREFGSSGMAADFANSGKGRLVTAARQWVSDHGYSMVPVGSRQPGLGGTP
jgi:hypothetical protein